MVAWSTRRTRRTLRGASIALALLSAPHLGLRVAGETKIYSETDCSGFSDCRTTDASPGNQDGAPYKFKVGEGKSAATFQGMTIHCPTDGQSCIVECKKDDSCSQSTIVVYGGIAQIDCENDRACKELTVHVASQNGTASVFIDCEEKKSAPDTCTNVTLTQDTGGQALFDIYCQQDAACDKFFIPFADTSDYFVRVTGNDPNPVHPIPDYGSGGCAIGEWACGGFYANNCSATCDPVDSVFGYFTGGSVAPTVFSPVPPSASPASASPISLSPLSLSPVSLCPSTYSPQTLSPTSRSPLTAHPVTSGPVTNCPSTWHPNSMSPGSSSPVTPSPVTLHPLTAGPVTFQPVTSAPVTLQPLTAGPVTFQPVTYAPVTLHPLTAGPVTFQPVTYAPVTLHPVTAGPVTFQPSTSAPVTLQPATSGPVTFQPVTSAPITLQPVTSGPVTLQPLTMTPVTLQPVTSTPVTLQPVTSCPVTSSPGTLAPNTAPPVTSSPITESPVTSSPVTQSPVTLTPVTESPVTLAPVTDTPLTSGPVTVTPSLHPLTQVPSLSPGTGSPGTISPETAHPASISPSGHPGTMSPIVTQGPVTTSPTSRSPTSRAPLTVSPVTATPTTVTPTGSPNTKSPTSSPITRSPVTVSPSLSIITVTVLHKHLTIKEDFPPWDSNSAYVNRSTDRFYVHNTEPGHTLDISCSPDTDKVELYHEKFRSDGETEFIKTSTIRIGGDDPTRWECVPNGMPGRASIRCNNGDTEFTNVNAPASCTLSALRQANIIPYGYSCPNPCFEDNGEGGGCYGSGNGINSVGVFSVRGKYATNSTQPTEFSITCGVDRLESDQSSGFQMGGTMENVIWPVVTDILVEYRGTYLSSTSEDQIVLTVATATSLMAQGEKTGVNDPFNPLMCPEVYIGDQPALNVSCTSERVYFVTPYYRDLCGDADKCGYFPIQIRNPDIDGKGKGGVLRCPPGCPKPGLGIYYTPECVGYTPTSVCAVGASNGDQNGLECSWGARDDCKICEKNGICPGGYRLWPKAGYYAETERVTSLVACPRPSLQRCLGWDAQEERTKCGQAYRGTLCGSCSDGYYESLGECLKCPEGGLEHKVEKLIYLIVLLFSLFVLITASVQLVYKNAPKQIKEVGFYQAKDFVLWSFLVLQIHGLVIHSASGLTPEVKELFSWLNIVNLEFQVVGAACFSGSAPFVWESIVLAVAIFACVFNVILTQTKYLTERGLLLKFNHVVSLRSLLFRVSTIIYTPVTYISLSLVACDSTPADDGGTIYLSRHNNNFKCYGEVHRGAAILAIFAFLICSIGYPVGTFVLLYNAKKKIETNETESSKAARKKWKMYSFFFGDDYYPRYFWALHVHFLVGLILAVTLVFCNEQNDTAQWSKLTVNVIAVSSEIIFLLIKDPYLPHVSWKKATKISILVVVGVNSILDSVNYLHETDRASSSSVMALSNIVFIGAILNFAILFFAFWIIVYPTESWKARMQTHFLIRYADTTNTIRENFKMEAKAFRSQKSILSKVNIQTLYTSNAKHLSFARSRVSIDSPTGSFQCTRIPIPSLGAPESKTLLDVAFSSKDKILKLSTASPPSTRVKKLRKLPTKANTTIKFTDRKNKLAPSSSNLVSNNESPSRSPTSKSSANPSYLSPHISTLIPNNNRNIDPNQHSPNFSSQDNVLENSTHRIQSQDYNIDRKSTPGGVGGESALGAKVGRSCGDQKVRESNGYGDSGENLTWQGEDLSPPESPKGSPTGSAGSEPGLKYVD
ncbi:hypothetical protein AAMO2058_001543200 [Amorphochlora amoebiformis]